VCGLVGFFNGKKDWNQAQILAQLKQMNDTLSHRGPDADGFWSDAENGIALAHRRLSIIDLSPNGAQPMLSGSGRYVLVLNGEIYNFQGLRHDFPQIQWRGHSDTEVMLAVIDAWGIEKALTRLEGMFAFALWDRETHRLHLGVDRLGEKPLYYGLDNGQCIFASELKALKSFPAWNFKINREAIAALMRYGYIPFPLSIYQNIHKLSPGQMLTLSEKEILGQGNVSPKTYWSLDNIAELGRSNPFAGSEKKAIEILEAKLEAVIAKQMIADVPLGAFLSGGIDSSTIVALMQKQSSIPVKTFTIGFEGKDYNEAPFAAAVAKHLKTEHHEIYLGKEQAKDLIPSLALFCDEPLADMSQVPVYLVAKLARDKVKVCLTGDGGDEIFGGYERYYRGHELANKLGKIPLPLRKVLASGISLLPDLKRLPGEKWHKLQENLGNLNPQTIYHSLVSYWHKPEEVVIGSQDLFYSHLKADYHPTHKSAAEWMMLFDAQQYLPGDILAKVDRASMAVSLETRIPLLHHDIVTWANTLPMHLKMRPNENKWVLRQVLYRHVPKTLLDRPKIGFSIPFESWLRGPLRDWCEALLNEDRLRREGFFHPAPIRIKWEEHLSGKRDWHRQLWCVLMFQNWLEHA
jgi:asparagine synthase (glutamine-hydrolysing)